jgi:hypothetical protein
LAALSNEIWTDAIRKALAEGWSANDCCRGGPMGLADRLMQIGRRCAALSDLVKRSPDEIVG